MTLPHAMSQVTVLTASLMLAGYGVFVFSVFAADLQHIISKGLTKCEFMQHPVFWIGEVAALP